MNRMKERAMRWVSAILPILLLILGMASPALAADYDLPILRGSSQPPAPVVIAGAASTSAATSASVARHPTFPLRRGRWFNSACST
jgi:hypothetical protein